MRHSLTAAALALVSGCVTTTKYDAALAERDGLQEELAARNKALASAERRGDGLKEENTELEKALANEKQNVRDLNDRLARLQAEMAAASKDKNALRANIEQMTLALAQLEQRRAESEARVNEYKALLSRFKALIDAGKLKVRIIDGRMVVVLATDVLFASGSANLSKEGKAAVAEVAGLLAGIAKRNFQVEGHTDNVPISTAQFQSNWELASARSINVVKEMVEAGMPAERISAASYGQHRPSVPNDSPQGKAQNRRIEIVIVPDLSTLPGFDQLQKLGG